MVIKNPVYFLINSLNPLKADCCQNTGQNHSFFQFVKIIIISTATFAPNISCLQSFHIYCIFNIRLFIFLFVDVWRRDFNFLEDTWMAPTTCSVFLLGHLAEGAAGTQPQPVCSYSDKQGACSSHSGNHPAKSQGQLQLHLYTLRAHSCDETGMRIHQHGIR